MFSDMTDYIKEVEKEVNFEDLVNRIYTADIDEDLRTKHIEKAFAVKDYLDKHSTAISSLSSNMNQYHYAVARKNIMDLHHLDEPDTKSQHEIHNKINESLSQVHKHAEKSQERVIEPPKKAKQAKPKDDSYVSLEDIPDERFDPPPPQQRNRGHIQDFVPPITPPKREDHEYAVGMILVST